MKPILVVDWHDVLEDYTIPFLKFLKSKNIDIQINDIWGSFAEMGIPEKYFIEFEESKEFSELPRIPGAQRALELLSIRYRIVCVSASPGIIKQHFKLKFRFPYIEKFLYAKPKNVIINKLGASIFIDDQIPHFEGVTCRMVAFSQPWNRSWLGERGNWEEILCLI